MMTTLLRTQERIMAVSLVVHVLLSDLGSERDYLGVFLLLHTWTRGVFGSLFFQLASHE